MVRTVTYANALTGNYSNPCLTGLSNATGVHKELTFEAFHVFVAALGSIPLQQQCASFG